MASKAKHFSYLQNNYPLAIAHRGGALDWPENTLEAFHGSYELGYRYIETDVHLTRDGQIVAFHDPSLERLGEQAILIKDLTWDEIQNIELQGGGRVPLLQDLIRALPEARFNIDMKSDDVVMPLLRLVEHAAVQERVCLASFFDHRVRNVMQHFAHKVCVSAGRREVTAQVFRSKGLPLGRPQVPVLQVPLTKYGVKIITPSFVDLCHREGKHVHVWTIDDAAQMNWLLDLGVDGIMTDRPRVLKEVLIERDQWQV